MSKRLVLIFVLVFVASLTVGGIIAYLFIRPRVSNRLPSYIQNAPLDNLKDLSTKPTADLVHKDESGFTFSYPRGVKIVDETPTDSVYYTMISLTKDSVKLTVSAQDTTNSTIDDYVKSQASYQTATLYGGVNLGGVSAKQYSVNGRLVTIAIDQGVLYLIDGPKDGSFWEETQGIVVNSFTFTDPSSGSASNGSIIEEPEVIVQ